jgi:truncated hemoglobin YjbI
MDAFYDRVEGDELLAPLFGGSVGEEHRRNVTFVAYVEWGTRLALANSQPGAEVFEHAPVPRWGWGEAPPFEG